MPFSKRVIRFAAASALVCGALALVRASVPGPQDRTADTIEPSRKPVSKSVQAGTKPAPESIVLIDPSHGGDDQGAIFRSKLSEKDITLSLGRELRRQLEERGIPAKMLRETDMSVSLDRRAEIANEPRTAVYIALHAGRLGKGVRVYAPLLASIQPASGRFLPWESAQATSLARSRKLALAVTRELKKKNIQAMLLSAPIRPLNSIVPPAIAIELAPDSEGVQTQANEKTLNAVASAIALAMAQWHMPGGARQ